MIEIQKALTALLELLSHPAPGFICVAAGEVAGPRYLARVRHFAKPPASDGDLRWILNRLRPLGKPYAALYALHDGARLFAPTISRLSGTDSRDGGFEYFPISDVRARSDERIASLLPGTTPSSELLAFAQIPLSANLICIGCTGEEKGKLIELNHDAPPGGFGIPQELAELLAFVSVDSALSSAGMRMLHAIF